MRIITKTTLRGFWEQHPRGAEARAVLETWYDVVRHTDWKTPSDVKATYGDASILGNNRVVFNIGGNRFRLVTHVNYRRRIVITDGRGAGHA